MTWNDIVHVHGPPTYRTAWRILGHAQDCEDDLQEARRWIAASGFEAMTECSETPNPPSDWQTWSVDLDLSSEIYPILRHPQFEDMHGPCVRRSEKQMAASHSTRFGVARASGNPTGIASRV